LPVHFFLDPAPHFIKRRAAPLPEPHQRRVARLQFGQTALPQKILVIQAQLFQAGAGHVGQLQLHLPRRARSLAALGDVLHS
jgi:hypothetical protein